MDWGFIGLIDVIIVALLLITIIVGYKKGFLKKAVGLVSFFVALIVAIVFCQQFADFLQQHELIYPEIYASIEAKVSSVESIQNLDQAENLSLSIQEVLGLPEFIANFIATKIDESTSAAEVITQISTAITDFVMVGVAAILLFVLVFIGALVLKILVYILRGNAIIRFCDGVVGVVFYTCLLMLFIYSVFAIFKACASKEFFAPVQEFLMVDMMLDIPEEFRLSKWIYEHNLVYSLFEFLFSK